MVGEVGEGPPVKRPWLWPFPKALTSLSLKKPLSLLLPVSPFFSLLLLHLNFYLSLRERMAFLASRVMGDQKVTG